MADQQCKQITNLESCRRLQALANYRESENDLYEAISVLNDALFYLNPRDFQINNESATEATKLKIDIWIKQVQLCLQLQKPHKAIPNMRQCRKLLIHKVRELVAKLIAQGILQEQLKIEQPVY